tara:strand:+ start:12 stop:992 length:981 start_codon:yes stop_codon:yes gene_type:complete
MIVLLVLLLSQVSIPKLQDVPRVRLVHLVEPSQQLADEYRFEIQQALEKGEEVYWASGELAKINVLMDLESIKIDFLLQASLDNVPDGVSQLNLYLNNSQNTFGYGNYLSKIRPDLFLGNVDLPKSSSQFVSLAGVNTFQVDDSGLLDSISGSKEVQVSTNLETEDFAYFLGEIAPSEEKFIRASLDAIDDVYGFDFYETEEIDNAKLVFDSKIPSDKSFDKLYFISTNFSFSDRFNLVSFSDSIDFEHSELVQIGKLPEVILENFLEFMGVEKQNVRLSQAQAERRFQVDGLRLEDKIANLNLLLLCLFVLCFGLERYLANQQRI